MGKLILRLDAPCIACIVESGQLLLATGLDPTNVGSLVEAIGDYPIEEVCVYLKPDSRSGLKGIQIDHVKAEVADYDFFVSDSDHDFVKAVAFVFKAVEIKYFSAFRYYASLTADGVVIDYFGDHDFIVAHIKDGLYRSFSLCSVDRLSKAVTVCNPAEVLYVSEGAIPELLNVSHIPVELHEYLSFINFVLNSAPCCVMNLESGELFTYGDQGKRPVFHVLTEDERDGILASAKENLPPILRKAKRQFSLVDVGVSLILLFAGICLALTIFTQSKISDDFTVMGSKQLEQVSRIRILEVEKSYLQDSVDNFDSSGVHARLMTLSQTVNH